jgi:hypothetical protein
LAQSRACGMIKHPFVQPSAGTMDQSIAGFTVEAPRQFLRDWALTVLFPGLGFGGFAVAVINRNTAPDDWIFIFILGTPALFWFVVGVLQARLLRRLIERPRVWAAATWGGGSLALIGGFSIFGWLTWWMDEVMRVGFEAEHPLAILLFAVSGTIAGLILGFLQAVTMRATWGERRYWLAWSAGAGALAFMMLWLGVVVITVMANGALDIGEDAAIFFASIAGVLLASALVHNLLTGIALRRLIGRRATLRKEAIVGQFD